ncbi:uncharacterized protein LOC131678978 [Topomyia yanbarensis]|uniref:uncharacterized protein LOC131678978 n=1 Tax=Topomyia yanbarensis TaxID=2498891 RepID=UPI00273B9F90|nr:uncharacterized protein LOC131678978 [Topomyia yanbarensis]XP_058815464.1 uncharacterized protein LOC131678978 [Topomyia yanbarensis]
MIRTKLKQKFWDFLNSVCFEPKRLIKIIVLSICSVVVVFQLTECFQKLINPPINTHSRFELNESMLYPAITFCRNPPYKYDVMQKYNLSQHPKYANAFNNFNFNESSLDELFREATYNQSDYFIQYGLDGLSENIEVIGSMHLDMGHCFTLNPLVTTNHSWKQVGYSILLMHDMRDEEYFLGEVLPGWHIFIHDPAEGFAENRMQSSGRVEYLFMEVDEEVEVKLTTQHFYMLPSDENQCTTESEMSSTRCSELCHWRHVVEKVGCTGPWMPGIEGEQCHTAKDTQQLIKYYKVMEDIDSTVCGCYQPCSSSIFTTYVMNRKHFNITIPAGQLWLYYTSKMVTIVKEFHGYDLTQFVADLGGSLGFLLGLSVLGLIGLLEKIVELIFIRRLIAEKRNKQKVDSNFEKSSDRRQDELSQTESSDATLAVANIKQ